MSNSVLGIFSLWQFSARQNFTDKIYIFYSVKAYNMHHTSSIIWSHNGSIRKLAQIALERFCLVPGRSFSPSERFAPRSFSLERFCLVDLASSSSKLQATVKLHPSCVTRPNFYRAACNADAV